MHDRSRGFTLIELLITVVVIGILAAIAIPRYAAAREKAYLATVISDLKVMAAQQETYQANTQEYADDVSKLTNLTLTEGVNLSINEANLGLGWAATGTHEALPDRTCGIYYGNGSAAQATPAIQAGVVACQD